MIEEKVLQNEVEWQKLNELFAAATGLEEAAREDFLRQIPDAKMRRKIKAMLKAANKAEADKFLEKTVFPIGAIVLSKCENFTGKDIGNYKILHEIGRGGMGAVFLAEHKNFKQKVALKIIKRGMDTEAIVQRFVTERRILAGLSHPNIARLFDGGTTPDGLPFFAMEYIEGLPVTEFCDRNKLNIEERLVLFRKICAAVAYAHQNLIVHRDIKPSNILVDKLGEPKLLDFGISKLLASDSAENTKTAAEFRLMTPEYASPEQIRGERVTTTSDIYSLGVLLYELLSGHRPFRLKNRPTGEILQIVSEQEPFAPSTAALTAEEIVRGETKEIISPETLADNRGERPERLRRRLQGDLDNIVLMSLRKEPERRYSSVEQFSEDLRRHLDHLAVLARPASFHYTTVKFFERNRTPVSFAAIALMAILAGFSIAVWQAFVARAERERAEQRFNDVRKLANTLLTEFDTEIGDLPGSYPTRMKLAKTSSAYLDGLTLETDDPELMKELTEAHYRLFDIYAHGFGEPDEAKKHLQKATEIALRLFSVAPDNLEAKDLLVRTTTNPFGRGVSEWEPLLRQRINLREEIVAANPPDFQAALDKLADANWSLADNLKDTGRREEAEFYYRRAVETYEKQISLLEKPELDADEHDFKFWANVWVGMIRGSCLNDWKAGLEASKKALEIAQTAASRFPDHRRLQTNLHMAYNRVAIALENMGNYHGALEQYENARRSQKEIGIRYNAFWQLTDVNYRLKIVAVRQKLGQTESALANLREALIIRRQVTEIDRANPRSNHAHADVFYRAGKIFAAAGRFDEALAAFREAENFWMKGLAINFEVRRKLGELYSELGDLYAVRLPGSNKIGTNNKVRLREGRDWYQKSITAFIELQEKNLAITEDGEKLRAAEEKLRLISEKLKAV